jgi:ketosteroid isomerase-like protein
MSLQLRITLVMIGLAMITSARVSAGRALQSGGKAQQEALTNERSQTDQREKDQSQVLDAVNTIFTAIQTDDAAKLNSVISPDFYVFDGGRRFNAEQLMAIFKAQYLAGKRHEWNVTEPDVHISGNTAWIAYVNDGSISDASGTVHQQWLESAFLEKQAGAWKILFAHSTRVPPPQEKRK